MELTWTTISIFATLLSPLLLLLLTFLLQPSHRKSRGLLLTSEKLYTADPATVAQAQKSKKRTNSYPTGFPEGWYVLCPSDDLRAGEVKYLEAAGEELAVYRGEDGKVRAVDAHCPHLGANLAVGGKVVGNCIRCPFHSWEFDGSSGLCTSIPYCSSVPKSARTRHWTTTELHGLVCFFYSLADDRRLAPPYPLEELKEIREQGHVFVGRRFFDVNMHIQEFAENSVDFQHFDPLHGGMIIPFTETDVPWVRIRHVARWEDDEEQPHIARFYDEASLLFREKEIPHSSAKASITFIGPGGLVVFRFHTEFGNIELFQTHTPVEPLKLRVGFHWYADPGMPSLLVSYVVSNWISQWKKDVMVWENKVYLRKPGLVKGDGPVMKLRRWFSQFYEHQNHALKTDW